MRIGTFLLSWVERVGCREGFGVSEGREGAGVCGMKDMCIPGGVVSSVFTVGCLQYLRYGVCWLGRLGFTEGWLESSC